MNEEQQAVLVKTVAEGEWIWPGRLSSALAAYDPPDPFAWRTIIDEALDAGVIKWAGPGERIRVVSAEDVEARQEAIRFADSHTPMALETSGSDNPPKAENPQPVKKRRRTAEEVAADKAAKEAGRAMTKLHAEALKLDKTRTTVIKREAAKAAKVLEREEAKAERVRIKAQAVADAKAAKLTEAEGGRIVLPAVVLRQGDDIDFKPIVKHVTEKDAWAVIEMYLGALCLDCETSGYPLGHELYELKTVQLGGEEAAIVFDASDPRQMEIAALALSLAVKLHAYSAIADVIPCVAAGLISWTEIWAKMYDAVFNAKLTDPKMSGSDADALKELSVQVLGDYAISRNAEIDKNALFKAMGCLTDTKLTTEPERNGWLRVNRNSVVMTRYAGSDVLDLAAVIRVLPPIPVSQAVVEREREFQDSCARVNLDGFPLDREHIKMKISEEETAKAQAQHDVLVLSNGLITNPKSPDVIKFLPQVIPGLVMPVNRKSKNESADKESLEKLCRDYPADTAPEAHYLFKRILAYRHHDTTLGLLLRPLNELCEHGDGRMRPTVYTIEASTGRTCIPESHTLLTQEGPVPVSEIKEGMLTLGRHGQWTRVQAVHRYADAPVVSVDNGRGLKFTCTPEHRWVTTLEHRPHDEPEMRSLCQETAAYAGGYSGNFKRLRLHLAPENRIGVTEFDFRSARIPADKFHERFAAIVGMLVTDGTCKDYGHGTGMRAKVYQTERKHYAEFMRVIPSEAVMHDRLTAPQEREIRLGKPLAPVTDMHEIRIKTRWLRPLLEDEIGYLPEGQHLRDAESLKHWVATIPLLELRAFFAACWLSDGCVPKDGRKPQTLSCGSENLRRVLALAAYRLGYVTTEHQPERPYLTFCRPVLSTRRSVPFEDGRADVWCVTTGDGTFTAVNSTGVMYLTGNSCRRPNGQQFSRQGGVRACVVADPGYLGISADFAGCEIIVAAALSGDRGLYEAENSEFCYLCREDPCACGKKHTGLHWRTAHGATANATKEHRYQAKRGTFTRLFGGGAETAAAQVGCPVRDMEAIFTSFNDNAPDFTSWDLWMRDCYKQGSLVWRDYTTGENYSQPIEGANRMVYQTYTGRNVYIGNGQHAAGNGAIQGTARELLVDGTLEWRRTRWGGYALLPVHDQLLTFVPGQEAPEATQALKLAMETDVLSSPGFPIHIGADVDVPFTAWPDSS